MAKDLRSKKINQIMYISIGCAIAGVILFTSLFIAFSSRKSKEKIDLQIGQSDNQLEQNVEDASSSIGKTVNEMSEYQNINEEENIQVQVSENDKTNSSQSNTTDNNKIDNNTMSEENRNNENNNLKVEEANNNVNSTQVEEEPAPNFIMPVEGEIAKPYGKEKLIYSDTLKEWTTHLGIDIKAEKTTIIKASADGMVKSIKNDPRYGLTVVIEHGNGYTSIYSNLLSAEFVTVGENVKSGQTIGTVGNSATFEILDASHLHFEILKDGNSINPEMYIK